jgi:hypothetical protein
MFDQVAAEKKGKRQQIPFCGRPKELETSFDPGKKKRKREGH